MARRSGPVARVAVALAGAAALSTLAPSARASNVTEFPDNGSEQMARGGAWVARASDPLATFFNPAGLAGQGSSLTLQSSLILHRTCFTRLRAASDASVDDLADPTTGEYPRVCRDIEPNLNPQIAGTLRVHERVTIGAAVLAPSSAANATWPEFVDSAGGPAASPNRYLINRVRGVILSPTVGVGVQVIDQLRLGASFSWGIAQLRLSSTSTAINTDGQSPANDVRSNLQAKDLFVPGLNLGALYSPTEFLDVGAWYKWSDSIRARGDVGTAANYYTRQNAAGDDSRVKYGDSIFEDCGTGNTSDIAAKPCGSGGNGRLTIAVPMEAKLGARYHHPRRRELGPVGQGADELLIKKPTTRDPLAQDLFDVELDLTWANNSAIEKVDVQFPANANGDGTLPVSGIPGVIPPSVASPRFYRDVFGARLGGDYALIQDRLAVRGGAFYETAAGKAQYQNINFAASWRLGLSLGAAFRVRFGEVGALDVMAGFAHVFFGTQENRGPEGVTAIAGTPCNPTASSPGSTCPDGREKYRTNWPVNLGTITNSINVFNLGATYRF